MTIRLLTGDCRDVLPTLPAESVQCVVTSPPYYGLRDYGTALWDGGDAACDHRESDKRSSRRLGIFHGGDDEFQTHPFRDTCGKCGAVRVDRQIGLEATPDEYLATMVTVFREVRRVLRRDGTCWVNMGDSYNANQGAGWLGNERHNEHRASPRVNSGLAAKQLLLMPARLALALQADGWWVRSDIIWHKPNPMPESCRDRPTSAHEHVFLLTRSARYYYDADAVRERVGEETRTAASFRDGGVYTHHRAMTDIPDIEKRTNGDGAPSSGRNLRNVWTIATSPYPNAHFATYPAELAERCIKAGTSERGCCAVCGKAWVRVTQSALYSSTYGDSRRADVPGSNDVKGNADQFGTRAFAERMRKETTTTGWAPGCQCRSLRCVSCSHVLDTRNASTKHIMPDMRQASRAVGKHAGEEVLRLALLQGVDAAENREAGGNEAVRDVRVAVQALDEAEQVLQPSLPWQSGEKAKTDTMPSMREGVHTTELPAETLLQGVRGAMGGDASSINEGLDDNEHWLQADIEEGSSEREQLRLRSGAPAGDGEEARQASDFGRGGASQERRSAGQPDQQPGTDGEASARRSSKADLSCDVPSLSDGVSDTRECPHCGSATEWANPATSPCVVLDCFAGAGTTALVADRLQRDCIGIDLNVSYTEMAMERCRADAPLFTSFPPAEPPEDERMADLFTDIAAD